MKILYAAPQHYYDDRSLGHSMEYYNFYQTLCAMGLEVISFDYPVLAKEIGRAETNRRLEQIVRDEKPDVFFGMVKKDQIYRRVMKWITNQTDTVTINWFCDDHWQYESDSQKWTPYFNYVVTTSQLAMTKYRRDQVKHIIKSQWGVNQHLYKPTTGPLRYDVTFVGQPYGIRSQAIEALQKAGISVNTWGKGWPSGKLDQAEMIDVFSSSKINLNFADSSTGQRTRLESFVDSHLMKSLKTTPVLWRAWDVSHRALQRQKQREVDNEDVIPRQIKGRVFEVPACGGLLMTQPAEDLEDYLRSGIDCVTFDSIDELVEKTRYYLDHEEERRAIALSGYQRTLADHTCEVRFREIFRQAGVPLDLHTPVKLAA